MRLTRRGRVVLAVAVGLLIAGQWGGYQVLRVLGAALLGAVAAALLLTMRGFTARVRRAVHPDRVERGRPALASLRVGNPGARRMAGFLATDTAGAATRTIRVRSLPAGAEAVYHYELPTSSRGRLTVGPLTLRREDPFGLAGSRLPTGETAPLWVHPRQLPARTSTGGYPRHHHEGVADDSRLPGSADLQDVREYVPGDEVRHLHWKATARTGRLMVRDLADPQQPRMTVVLDTRAQALAPARFEEAVEVAASLLAASARAGHHSRLVTSGGRDLPTSGGAQAARRLLDELCVVGQDAVRDAAVLPRVLATDRWAGGSLVIVTGGTAGLVLPRHRFRSIFVVDLAGGVPAGVPGGRVLRADSAAAAVSRWNQVLG
ncbi:DUF58 domain-containing protein [Micromonospora sp. NBC_01813]|uniref:DUF58 domain-containing protein n=1 Tax=Micromonospora sp. NBC_01813 TaxID=2975988 RepID=UPI002DD7E7D4|nr:DUF58 domain-containing protein [Micromonospora sp. NBC_01813]WSA06262.1 DUF58 domain-containing protein [Micromonospora sp. NBC_01813]